MPAARTLDALRARIESIERHAPEGGLRPSAHAQSRRTARTGPDAAGTETSDWDRAFSFGMPALDAHFSPGGPPFGAHEVCGAAGEPATALLFTLLILARLFRDDPDAQSPGP